MPVESEKRRLLTEALEHKKRGLKGGREESVAELMKKFTRCRVDPEDGCTYCQRADNSEWEKVYCPRSS